MVKYKYHYYLKINCYFFTLIGIKIKALFKIAIFKIANSKYHLFNIILCHDQKN